MRKNCSDDSFYSKQPFFCFCLMTVLNWFPSLFTHLCGCLEFPKHDVVSKPFPMAFWKTYQTVYKGMAFLKTIHSW
mgnify:CR=1 FL=1